MKDTTKAVAEELQRLAAEHGGTLKPELVVEAARPKKSPLHSRFTWDDGYAAHQHRLWEARQLIRVMVTVIPRTNLPERVWVSLTPDREPEGAGYRTLVSVLSHTELREQLLAEAMRDLETFRAKYGRLKELARIFREFDRLRKGKAS